jgi:serine/threonine protein kinase/tetratricopeptide (TPR) repeat protein
MRLTSGTRLGPYEILSPLGAGGMGEVYRARDSKLDREVAVKVLPQHLASNPEALERFEREAKAIAALSHPNILAIHDFSSEAGNVFAVTELLEGETLGDRLERGPVPWREAAQIGLEIADGLSAAHARGIAHRDLKPDNVFLTAEGRVKILDFGLARTFRVTRPEDQNRARTTPMMTEPGFLVGTVGYVAPEQVRGLPADARSDIFSFGCLLYEMVTGQRPFTRETAAETMTAILKEDPPVAAGSGRLIPPELDRVIAHCLEKNPDARFQSARDLAFALKASLGSSAALRDSVATPLPRGRALRRQLAAAAAVLALCAGFWLATRRGRAIDSLAVLPLVNESHDPNAEYLSDGITESIIDNLSQLPELRVMSRSSAFRYKRDDVDPQKAGRELNVRAVLTGRLEKRGDTLIVRTELVDVGNGSQLWGEQYRRRLSDLYGVQEEISREISQKLRLRLTGEDKQKLSGRPPANPEAYQAYLKGRFYWNKRTEEGFRQGIASFREAIEKDPAYAPAYTGLADSYALLSDYGFISPKEAMPRAREAAEKALAIDERLAEAHNSLAFVLSDFDWDWAGAEKNYRRAIELNPRYSNARHWYALFLTGRARFDEAFAEIDKARELDPLSLIINKNVGWVAYFARQYDRAVEAAKKTLELDPDFGLAYSCLGLAYEQKGMSKEAVQAMETQVRILGRDPDALLELGHAYATAGRRADARKILVELEEISRKRYIPAYYLAELHAGLGDRDRAFEELARSLDDHVANLTYLKVEPKLDSLRSDPRFSALLSRMHMAP